MTQDAKTAGMPDDRPSESETEQDVSELARSVVQELEPGTMIEDKLILSRRISSPDDDYEIQKNGTDGTGIINFKT